MVGLLTLDSRIYNYGGFLQEMALQDAIKGLGYKCEIIDYEVSQEFNTFSLKRGIKNFSFDKIKTFVRLITPYCNILLSFTSKLKFIHYVCLERM